MLLIAFTTSFLLSCLMTWQVIKILKKKGWYDAPGGRKLHKEKTPSFGGVPIFVSLLVCISAFSNFYFQDSFALLCALSLLFACGLLDDAIGLSPLSKLGAQVLAVLIYLQNEVFYDGVGFTELFSFLLVLLFFLTIINAFNFIDGVNGLAGSTGVLISVFFLIYFFVMGSTDSIPHIIIVIGALLGFLVFNWKRGKIFMGDTGSLVIGFCLASFCYQIFEVEGPSLGHKMVVMLSFFCYLFIDLFRVLFLRLRKGRSPFRADKRHIHHVLLRLKMTPVEICCTVLLFTTLFSMFTVSMIRFFNYQTVALVQAVVVFGALKMISFKFKNKKWLIK